MKGGGGKGWGQGVFTDNRDRVSAWLRHGLKETQLQRGKAGPSNQVSAPQTVKFLRLTGAEAKTVMHLSLSRRIDLLFPEAKQNL